MHPFLQFPQLYYLSFFIPTLMRVAAAIIFFLIAKHTYVRRDEIANVRLPLIGNAAWAVWFAIVVETLIGLSLLLGYYAQVGALIGALGALKFIILKHRIGGYAPISRTASFLLLVICLSIIVSGAGAFAMDVPL